MGAYISTFPTGFAGLIPAALQKLLPRAQVVQVYDGLVHYRYGGKPGDLGKVFLFHNTFLVLREFQGPASQMDSMVRSAAGIKSLPPSRGSFRVRYSVKNQFVAVPKERTRQLEGKIAALTHAKVDRVSPDTEYWFLQRSEGVGFFCRLLGRRQATERDLHPGELRPELAYLMASLAKLGRDSVVLDPFAGYGAIPKQVLGYFPYAMVLVSDLDRDRAVDLRASLGGKRGVSVAQRDALTLEGISGATVDAIITDPPWGYYEEIENIQAFYRGMFASFRRVLKPRGPGGAALRPEAGGRGRRPGDGLPPAPAVRHLGQREEGRRLPAGGGPRLIKGTSAPPGLGPLCRAGWGFPPAAGGWSRRSSPEWR